VSQRAKEPGRPLYCVVCVNELPLYHGPTPLQFLTVRSFVSDPD